MLEKEEEVEDKKIVIDANYIVFVIIITILTVLNSVLIVVLGRYPELRNALATINACLSVFLLADAFWRLRKLPQRVRYLFQGEGWLVFVGSLPVPFFGIARLIYYGRMTRRLRHDEFREARNVIVTKRAQSTLLLVLIFAIVVYEAAILLIISVEARYPGANITTANDALWWGYVTVATVGYGDYFPVSTPGRIIGAALMTVGVALFTSITSFMADWFRRPRSPSPIASTGVTAGAIRDPHAKIARLRAALAEQEKANQETIARLQAQLDELELDLRLQHADGSSQTQTNNPENR
ncbi:MAG: potassium channel family protein [Caldilineaceae bacterium]|nr:potassium channel family protein [Caldilineaceae bacterium]